MLTSLFRSLLPSIFGSCSTNKHDESRAAALAEEAERLSHCGKIADADRLFRESLILDPLNAVTLNNYGSLLMQTRRIEEAIAHFQKAITINDQFAPALVNLAYAYVETFRSKEADSLLETARQVVVNSPYIDFGLGRIKLFRGNATQAAHFYLSAWIRRLDERVFAQGYLFNLCYSDEASARTIAAEHGFWANTLPSPASDNTCRSRQSREKIRIGYLSPDFREHSVRYFALPLIRNHDRDRFEVYAYSDSSYADIHTGAIRDTVDVLRTIGDLPDAEVSALIANDDLDILVELAGHTSGNRMDMLAKRHARLQVSAIGYPPTTGLGSIDYKVVDVVAAPIGTEHYYSEQLLRLPETFWCFDPGEPYTEVAPPPRLRNGHITFGCFGNIGKISDGILNCWSEILAGIPGAKLVIRGITFQDGEARLAVERRLKEFRIDSDRTSLLPPTKPEAFASAYADVDIILDTFPFNGGTTTCHALWNGVPVVTLAGEILLSRMGASMLSAVGLRSLIAESPVDYVSAAIDLAHQTELLDHLRSSLRSRMRGCALGNGKRFASQFESACIDILQGSHSIDQEDQEATSQLPAVSELEAVRRARVVISSGNIAAAKRVVEYVRRNYPCSTGNALLGAWVLETDGDADAAYRTLLHAPISDDSDTRHTVATQLLRLELATGRLRDAEQRSRDELGRETSQSGRMLFAAYNATARAMLETGPQLKQSHSSQKSTLGSISVVVCSVDPSRLERMRRSFDHALGKNQYELLCIDNALSLAEGYNRVIKRTTGDILIFSHDDVEILGDDFRNQLELAAAECDIIGVAGATRVSGPTWWHAGIDYARGAVAMPLPNNEQSFALSVYGGFGHPISHDIACLDGLFLVVKRHVLEKVRFDEVTFDGFHLYDMDFTFTAAKAGFRIGVAPKLALLHHSRGSYDATWASYASRFLEKHNLPTKIELLPPFWGVGIELPDIRYLPKVLDRLYVGDS